MSERFGGHDLAPDPFTVSAARAALAALAEADGATWILCDAGGRASLVGAGAAALVAASPGGEARFWGALVAAVRDPGAGLVQLAPGVSASLT
ncbi:MAG: hypothetical protein RIT28_3808, partial [Pseudomonadota bacterium]